MQAINHRRTNMSNIDFQNGLAVGMVLAGKNGLVGQIIVSPGPGSGYAGYIDYNIPIFTTNILYPTI
jgi:hypothetical protein